MQQTTVDGSGGTVVSRERAASLIDELRRQEQLLGAVQARRAALMVEFGDVRRGLDQRVIGDLGSQGRDARYRAGEFAVTEISLAVTASKFGVSRVVGMARRLRAEAPDVWDSWCAGEIDHDKALRVNRALRRLVRDDSKQLLNNLVVAVAPLKTPELLGRWLNQFISEIEPDETDERLRRAFEDRYVSVRPDIDGISFLHAALSCVDAAAIDQLLTELAGDAAPGDERTLAQRRADALVDVLCGRTSNGCHGHDTSTGFDTNTDADDHLDDADDPAGRPDGEPGDVDAHGVVGRGETSATDDFGLPASVFRPDPRSSDDIGGEGGQATDPDADDDPHPGSTTHHDVDATEARERRIGREPESRAVAGIGARGILQGCAGQQRPLPVTIGIVVTASALFGYSNTPGQLADRSSLIPADIVRDLANQPGTLFHRLITDDSGNLLEVTELGRFPSRKLGLAVRYRDPVCVSPTCHTAAPRCDLDHLTPVPEGRTAGVNLGPECRGEHRAKTHGGHSITRTGPHGTEWTTPTGHRYSAEDPPLPVDIWPSATDPGSAMPDSPAAPQPDPALPLPKHRKPTRKRKRRRN